MSAVTLARQLQDALAEAVVAAIDPADDAVAAALAAGLRAGPGLPPLGALEVQVGPPPRPAGAAPPLPDPEDPDWIEALDGTDLGMAPLRRGVLARHLLGRFELDPGAVGEALAGHPTLHALARATAAGPTPWAAAVAGLWLGPAAEGRAPAARARLAEALLELWALSEPPGGAPAVSARLGLRGADPLLRAVGGPVAVAAAAGDGGWAPLAACRACGASGLGLRHTGSGLDASPGPVQRAWAAGSPDRRFLWADALGSGAGADACPACGEAELALVGVNPAALAGLAAELLGATELPAGVAALAGRGALRRALARAAGDGAPGPRLPALSAALDPRWSEREREWAVHEELGPREQRALGLSRLGLAALHLDAGAAAAAAQALAAARPWLPAEAPARALHQLVRAMARMGAIFGDAARACLAGGGNAALLPRRLPGGGRAPRFAAPGPGPLAELMGRCLQDPRGERALDDALSALRAAGALLSAPGVGGAALAPAALRLSPGAVALRCPRGHRRVDVPAHLAGLWAGGPCPHPGCSAALAPAPRPYGALGRALSEGLGAGPAVAALDGGLLSFTVALPAGRLRLLVEGM